MKKKYLLLFILPILIVGYVYYERSLSTPENKDHKTVAISIESADHVSSQLSSKTEITRKKAQQELSSQLAEYQALWRSNDRTVPVKEYLDYLLEEVTKQNADAQYQLTTINVHCYGIPKTEEALQSRLSRTPDKKRQKVIIRDYEYCEDYNVDLTRAQVNDLIIKAARGGNLYAKFGFAGVAFPVLTPSEAIARAEEMSELKKEAMGYLFDVKNAGIGDSLYFLGNTYFDGELTGQDYEEAYAYYYAYDIISDKTTPTSQMALASVEGKISQEQMNRAVIKGEQYANCCK